MAELLLRPAPLAGQPLQGALAPLHCELLGRQQASPTSSTGCAAHCSESPDCQPRPGTHSSALAGAGLSTVTPMQEHLPARSILSCRAAVRNCS